MAKKKLPGPLLTKREGMRRLAEKQFGPPPVTRVVRKSKGEGTGLMIMVPTETLKALRRRRRTAAPCGRLCS